MRSHKKVQRQQRRGASHVARAKFVWFRNFPSLLCWVCFVAGIVGAAVAVIVIADVVGWRVFYIRTQEKQKWLQPRFYPHVSFAQLFRLVDLCRRNRLDECNEIVDWPRTTTEQTAKFADSPVSPHLARNQSLCCRRSSSGTGAPTAPPPIQSCHSFVPSFGRRSQPSRRCTLVTANGKEAGSNREKVKLCA